MNLLDLFVTIGVKDEASSKVAGVAKTAQSSMSGASKSTGKLATALSRVGEQGAKVGAKL